jgi:hypothetical protein
MSEEGAGGGGSGGSRSERWLAKIKNRPLIAVILVCAAIYLGTVKWLDEASESTKKVWEMLGWTKSAGEKKELRSHKLTAYQLGKAMVTYSVWLQEDSVVTTDEAKKNMTRQLGQQGAEINARVANLSLMVDVKNLDFTCIPASLVPNPTLPCNDFHSPAFFFLWHVVKERYGDEVQRAFSLGGEFASYHWRMVLNPSSFVYVDKAKGELILKEDQITWYDQEVLRTPEAGLANLRDRAMDITGEHDAGRMRFLSALGPETPNPMYNFFNSGLDTIDQFITEHLEK